MGDQLVQYSLQVDEDSNEVTKLMAQIQELRTAITANTSTSQENEDVQKLSAENTKLKHRLAILENAYASQSKQMKKSTAIESTQEVLHKVFSAAIHAAITDIKDPPVVIALSGKDPKFGDYQCNSALPIANIYKQLGKKVSPQAIAKLIVENMPCHSLIERLEIAGPGFINIFLSKSYGATALSNILEHGVQPPPLEKPCKVVVDFSSPNIAKEMHVGHLRSTIIGESVSRLLEFLGHEVVRTNHIGDWGTQFGMLIEHMKEKFPDYATVSPPISDLQAFYKESKGRFDNDLEFKKRAYAAVVKLQAHEPEHYKAWQLICDVSRAEFKKVYDRLDITITEVGESFYQSRMNDVVKLLESKNFLEDDDGRKIMWGNKNAVPLTIVKSDGGYTYDTSDMAAIRYRIQELSADWIIYITDSGQLSHFEIMWNCARKAGILTDKVRVDHCGFGVVLGEDRKKFKTRSGDTVRLTDLLDEGLKRALDRLEEKERDKVLTPEELKKAQESIAYGCIRYADMCHNRNHEYIFSFNKMLEDKGNTAVYMLYAYTRIRSIARNAGLVPEDIKNLMKTSQVSLDHEKEWKLAKALLRYPDVLVKITQDLCLHHLCEYLYEIATTFTEFYDVCYCIEKDSGGKIVKVNSGRILLVEVTALVMAKCFYILGLNPVSKM